MTKSVQDMMDRLVEIGDTVKSDAISCTVYNIGWDRKGDNYYCTANNDFTYKNANGTLVSVKSGQKFLWSPSGVFVV